MIEPFRFTRGFLRGRRRRARFPPDFTFQLSATEVENLKSQIVISSWLARKLDALEQKYDVQFRAVFDAIRELMAPAAVRGRPIGFRA